MKAYILPIVTVLFLGVSMPSSASFLSWLFGKNDTQASESEDHTGHDHDIPVAQRQVGTLADFQLWQSTNPSESQNAKAYEAYLKKQLGNEVPPMYEMLTSARAWQECGYEPYQVPPEELWENMIPTLKLYSTLKWRGIIPSTAKIRSVYRSPELNRCAGGAASSKHINNAAIDIWVPEYGDNSAALFQMKDNLCQFWKTEGQTYNFGLGLYATGAIHLDTQGYRKWGLQFSSENSPCREVQEKLYIDGQF